MKNHYHFGLDIHFRIKYRSLQKIILFCYSTEQSTNVSPPQVTIKHHSTCYAGSIRTSEVMTVHNCNWNKNMTEWDRQKKNNAERERDIHQPRIYTWMSSRSRSLFIEYVGAGASTSLELYGIARDAAAFEGGRRWRSRKKGLNYCTLDSFLFIITSHWQCCQFLLLN